MQPADAHCRSCGAPRTATGRSIVATQQMPATVVPTQPMTAQMSQATPPDHAAPDQASHGQAAQGGAAPGPKRPPANHALTAVANEAFTMVRAFEVAFGKPFPGWKGELREPVGPSTGGGKQSLQAISIVDQQGHRLAVGSVDSAKRAATLRSYAMVAAMHEARFDGDPFLVREADYTKFIDGVSNLLSSMSIAVKVETVAPSPRRAPPEPDGGAGFLWFVGIATVIAIAIAAYIALS